MPDLLLYPLLTGCGLAIITGPLGCFVVWRKMAYFGDTLSHSALLGVALGLLLNINLNIAVIICCLAIAFFLAKLQRQKNISSDALLGILAHSSLSIGLVFISLSHGVRVDLISYLFGDLLATNMNDLYQIYIGGSLILGVIIFFWNPLLMLSIDADLAQAEGIPTERMNLILTLLIALVIGVAMKIVGILLITSLLIIPAATARSFAKTPEQMACLSSLIGILAVTGGIAASWYLDTPAGPSVVVSSFILFLISQIARIAKK